MASTLKVDKIEGSTGSTVTIPTGQTLTVTDGIPVASGGTGLASFTTGDILYATGSTTLAKLGKGTGLQGLQTNSGATAPEWANSPQSLMTAAGDILYASGANTLAKLAKGSDDEVLTLASGVPSWAEAASGGLTVADQWRLTANRDGPGVLTANLEQCDTAPNDSFLGSAMTESSGVFTFPSTGYWYVAVNWMMHASGGSGYNVNTIEATTDNSSYVVMTNINTRSQQSVGQGDALSWSGNCIIDVTDVSNVKVKFNHVSTSASPTADQTSAGDSTKNETYFTFMKLGDT